uniref:Uncharacterized protein n=1 Tax=Palpitomonas bilix TaxID=652834 RepID=A0A7S3GG64_9EUKA|mmetsp:Transcript_47728/g.123769  ORF Transcript_47728/g.123769 Transcript_47728/m.123769 type:complete len:933 (+) Transcript_47728:334-3132(+)
MFKRGARLSRERDDRSGTGAAASVAETEEEKQQRYRANRSTFVGFGEEGSSVSGDVGDALEGLRLAMETDLKYDTAEAFLATADRSMSPPADWHPQEGGRQGQSVRRLSGGSGSRGGASDHGFLSDPDKNLVRGGRGRTRATIDVVGVRPTPQGGALPMSIGSGGDPSTASLNEKDPLSDDTLDHHSVTSGGKVCRVEERGGEEIGSDSGGGGNVGEVTMGAFAFDTMHSTRSAMLAEDEAYCAEAEGVTEGEGEERGEGGSKWENKTKVRVSPTRRRASEDLHSGAKYAKDAKRLFESAGGAGGGGGGGREGSGGLLHKVKEEDESDSSHWGRQQEGVLNTVQRQAQAQRRPSPLRNGSVETSDAATSAKGMKAREKELKKEEKRRQKEEKKQRRAQQKLEKAGSVMSTSPPSHMQGDGGGFASDDSLVSTSYGSSVPPSPQSAKKKGQARMARNWVNFLKKGGGGSTKADVGSSTATKKMQDREEVEAKMGGSVRPFNANKLKEEDESSLVAHSLPVHASLPVPSPVPPPTVVHKNPTAKQHDRRTDVRDEVISNSTVGEEESYRSENEIDLMRGRKGRKMYSAGSISPAGSLREDGAEVEGQGQGKVGGSAGGGGGKGNPKGDGRRGGSQAKLQSSDPSTEKEKGWPSEREGDIFYCETPNAEGGPGGDPFASTHSDEDKFVDDVNKELRKISEDFEAVSTDKAFSIFEDLSTFNVKKISNMTVMTLLLERELAEMWSKEKLGELFPKLKQLRRVMKTELATTCAAAKEEYRDQMRVLEDVADSMSKKIFTPTGSNSKEFWTSLLLQMDDFLDRMEDVRKQDIGADWGGSEGRNTTTTDVSHAISMEGREERMKRRESVLVDEKGGLEEERKVIAQAATDAAREKERQRLQRLRKIVSGISNDFPVVGKVIEEFRQDIYARGKHLGIEM